MASPIEPEFLDRWAHAYIEAALIHDEIINDTREHPLWWAFSMFHRMYTGDILPNDCWRAILRILELDPPKNVVGLLAAGPLEDLIREHGPEFIERIEFEAKHDRLFRFALGGVWQSDTKDEIWARVEKARSVVW